MIEEYNGEKIIVKLTEIEILQIGNGKIIKVTACNIIFSSFLLNFIMIRPPIYNGLLF